MVGGSDDERFVNRIVRPALAKKYNVHTYEYAGRSKDAVNRFISGIRAIPADDYIMFADTACCMVNAKSLWNSRSVVERLRYYTSHTRWLGVGSPKTFGVYHATKKLERNATIRVDPSRMAIADVGIESWYAAGLPIRNCKALGISIPPDTRMITKDEFDGMIPAKFLSRIDFMMYLLEKFSLDIAKERNSSFRYCWSKFVEPAAP